MSYWTEKEWEKHLEENERLMDRYEQAVNEKPERDWDDFLDLYYKVHHGIDLGEELSAMAQSSFPEDESAENPSIQEAADEFPAVEEDDDLDKVEAYRLAYDFSLSVLGFLKKAELRREEDPLMQGLASHGLKVAADIAGGHGLGYDEDALCGNIVKNRWALGHLNQTRKILKELIERDGGNPVLHVLMEKSGVLEKSLEKRIADLRSQVWWG